MNFSKPYIKAGVYAGLIGIVIAILANIPFINCIIWPITCIAFFVIPGGAGYYASMQENHGPDDINEAIRVGALAGAVAGTIRGLANMIINIISYSLLSTVYFLPSLTNITSGDAAGVAATSTLSLIAVVLSGLIALILYIVSDTIFGLIGALIQTYTNKSKQEKTK